MISKTTLALFLVFFSWVFPFSFLDLHLLSIYIKVPYLEEIDNIRILQQYFNSLLNILRNKPITPLLSNTTVQTFTLPLLNLVSHICERLGSPSEPIFFNVHSSIITTLFFLRCFNIVLSWIFFFSLYYFISDTTYTPLFPTHSSTTSFIKISQSSPTQYTFTTFLIFLKTTFIWHFPLFSFYYSLNYTNTASITILLVIANTSRRLTPLYNFQERRFISPNLFQSPLKILSITFLSFFLIFVNPINIIWLIFLTFIFSLQYSFHQYYGNLVEPTSYSKPLCTKQTQRSIELDKFNSLTLISTRISYTKPSKKLHPVNHLNNPLTPLDLPSPIESTLSTETIIKDFLTTFISPTKLYAIFPLMFPVIIYFFLFNSECDFSSLFSKNISSAFSFVPAIFFISSAFAPLFFLFEPHKLFTSRIAVVSVSETRQVQAESSQQSCISTSLNILFTLTILIVFSYSLYQLPTFFGDSQHYSFYFHQYAFTTLHSVDLTTLHTSFVQFFPIDLLHSIFQPIFHFIDLTNLIHIPIPSSTILDITPIHIIAPLATIMFFSILSLHRIAANLWFISSISHIVVTISCIHHVKLHHFSTIFLFLPLFIQPIGINLLQRFNQYSNRNDSNPRQEIRANINVIWMCLSLFIFIACHVYLLKKITLQPFHEEDNLFVPLIF